MHGTNRKIYEFDTFRLDVSERQLLKGEKPVAIPPKAFDLLVVLVENSGSLVERESLYARVWPDSIVEDANLTVHISAIRKALEKPSCISTVSGHGYRFNWSVRELHNRNGRAALQTNPIRLERFVSGANHFTLPEADEESLVQEPKPSTKQVASSRGPLIAGIIGVALVTAIGIGSYIYLSQASAKPIESIAVMPFVNDTGDPDLDYLSDGMTLSVMSALSKIPNISIKARTSVFGYKDKNTALPTIGRELGVQALLNGRLVKSANDVTLFVELIDPATERILWSENYNRSVTNLITLQSDIARDVSRTLSTKLSSSQQELARSEQANPEAYQLYLRGRYHWNKREPADLREAINYFNRAIALDPEYGGSYAGLADTYALYFDYTGDFSTEARARAKEAALTALSLDERSAEAHASLGGIMHMDYDFTGAEREFKRAIDLDPDYAVAHQWYGLLHRSLGRFDEMFAEYRRAMELEPLSPLLPDVYGAGLSWAQRYDEALLQFNESLELDPSRPIAHAWIAYAHWGKGDYPKAVHHFSKAKELHGRGEIAARMRKAFADGGWQGFLRASAEDPEIQASPYERARCYSTLGQKDRAFQRLNEAYEMRESKLRNLRIDPFLDGIRDDPRYAELVRRIGFPE